jgi:hypothetical protein
MVQLDGRKGRYLYPNPTFLPYLKAALISITEANKQPLLLKISNKSESRGHQAPG